MRRRDVLSLLGGAAVSWPVSARAQQGAMPVIGMLAVIRLKAIPSVCVPFETRSLTAGYVDGQNVEIRYRWAEAHTGRLPELAAELVRSQVSVLVAAGGTASALAAKAATSSIPIVFGIGADPVEIGLVASFNRPRWERDRRDKHGRRTGTKAGGADA